MIGKVADVPHLLKNWDQVAPKIRSHRNVVVFLDFDGTLVRIAPKPEQVKLARTTKHILSKLASNPRITVAIVSGRRRSELQNFIGIHGIHYFGLYGWERPGAPALPARSRRALQRAHRQLAVHLSVIPRLWIEDKKRSLSVHIRGVSPSVQQWARREIRSLLKPFNGTLRIFENLRDVEIVPSSIPGKGIAVREFLMRRGKRGFVPFYFGDDYSDEPAFSAVRSGVSVHVGRSRPTQASFHLRGPAQVAAALRKLEAELA